MRWFIRTSAPSSSKPGSSQRQENPNMATSQRPHLRRRDMPRRQAGGGAPRARHGRVGTHTDSRDEVAHRLIATGDHGHRRDTAHHHHVLYSRTRSPFPLALQCMPMRHHLSAQQRSYREQLIEGAPPQPCPAFRRKRAERGDGHPCSPRDGDAGRQAGRATRGGKVARLVPVLSHLQLQLQHCASGKGRRHSHGAWPVSFAPSASTVVANIISGTPPRTCVSPEKFNCT